jgi:membrane protein
VAENLPADLLARARRFVVEGLWAEDLGPRRLTAAALRGLQLVVLVARGFIDDRLLLRASALTYMTSLAVIPVLVVVLSIIEWLGFSRGLAVWVVDRLLAGSPDAVDWIMGVVGEANVGALGSLGGAIFLATTVLSLRHIEETFNEIWGARSSRGWLRRFTNYLAVLVVVPLLLGTAISLATTFQSGLLQEEILPRAVLSALMDAGLAGAPTVFLFVSFALVYWLLPNTYVRPVSALLGALVAAVMFIAAQHLYVNFSIGVARYNALFGGFAMLPLLLIWIYLSWSIVLMGAEIAYAHQHLARYRREARNHALPAAEREATAVRLALQVARSFRDREPAESLTEIADALEVSLRAAAELLDRLETAGIVRACQREEQEASFQLGRPAEDITVSEVLNAIRGGRRAPATQPGDSTEQLHRIEMARTVNRLLGSMESIAAPLGSRSLSDLLAE